MGNYSVRVRKRWKVILFVFLAAAIAVVFVCVFLPPEPSYQGKTVTQWIRGLEYENENPTDEMRAALRAMGEPAVTRLIAILNQHDSLLKRKFLEYARRHTNLWNRYVSTRKIVPESVYRSEAATALGELGPAAQAAIPSLTAAGQDPDFIASSRAQAALMNIRQVPPDSLLPALENPRSSNWGRAAFTVKYLGSNGQVAIPLLVRELEDTNIGVRQQAAMSLGGIASQPDFVVPALLSHLKDPNPSVRRAAIDALIKFPGEKARIIPALLSVMRDPDNNEFLGASFGLEQLLTPDEKKTIYVPALIESLDSPVVVIRLNAATFLKRVDPATAAAMLSHTNMGGP